MTTAVNDRLAGPFTATAGQTLFSFDFPAVADDDVLVLRRRAGVETALTRGVHYSVSRSTSSGFVMLATPGAAAGDEYLIAGDMDLERTTQFHGWRSLPAETVEAELDQLLRGQQELERDNRYQMRRSYFTQDWDGAGARLTNVADGIEPDDAATLAQVDAVAGSADAATAAAASAAISAELAQMLANAAGAYTLFDTKAQADTGLGSVAADAYIMVIADETRGGSTVVYQKVSGAYVFKRQTTPQAADRVVDTIAQMAALTSGEIEAGRHVDLRYGSAYGGFGSTRFITLAGSAASNGFTADGIAVVQNGGATRTFVRQEFLDNRTLDLSWWSPPAYGFDAQPQVTAMFAVVEAHSTVARPVRCAIRRAISLNAAALVPNNIRVDGEGVGLVSPLPTMALSASLFIDKYPPTGGVRNASNIVFEGLRFDGTPRPYPSWLTNPDTGAVIADPAADYSAPGVINETTYPGANALPNPIDAVVAAKRRNPAGAALYAGYMIYLRGAVDSLIYNCHARDHGNSAFVIAGGLNSDVRRCSLYRIGRVSMSSNAVLVVDHGSAWLVTGISKGVQTVVTTLIAHGFSENQDIDLLAINWGVSIPDGNYKAGTILTPTTFVLRNAAGTDIDSSSFASTYQYDGLGLAANDGYVIGEDCGVEDCDFRELRRGAIQLSGRRPRAHDNRVLGSRESGIYLIRTFDHSVKRNTIRDVTIADLVANGIECNYVYGGAVESNSISFVDSNGLAVIGCYGGAEFTKNRLRRPGHRGPVLRPYGPFSERYGYPPSTPIVAGIALPPEERCPIRPQAFGVMGFQGRIDSNIVIENRTTPIHNAAIQCQRANGAADGAFKNSELTGNDLRQWPILAGTDPALLIDLGTNVVDPQTVKVRGNKKHPSDRAFVMVPIELSATGLADVVCGFPPSAVEVHCFSSGSALPARMSFGGASKTEAPQTAPAANCFCISVGDTTGAAVNRPADLGVLRSAAGSVEFLMDFDSWRVDGVRVNVTTAAIAATAYFKLYP